jgi:Protein of unknown function (DUF1236)
MKIVFATLAALVFIVGVFVYFGQGPVPDAGSQRSNQAAGESAAGRSQDMSARSAADRADGSEQGARAREVQATGSGEVPLSAEQRTRVRDYFAKSRSNIADSDALSISIGASVPRQIATQPLPPEIVDLIDKYRGDEYFIASDRLVVVEPKSRRIVAIIPMTG